MKNHLTISVILTILLSGCAANTGIVKISDDTYMYSKQEWEAMADVEQEDGKKMTL